MESNPGDIAAVWDVRLADGNHKIVFEHGTTSGKRVIKVDGNEVLRRNWMFRLVGNEGFRIGRRAAEVEIAASSFSSFEYTLKIDGKSLKKFIEAQIKNTRVWLPEVEGTPHRVVLDIETMDIYVDGAKVETVGEFTDTGAETHFNIGSYDARITTESSGNKHKGLLFKLAMGSNILEPVKQSQ